jgi:hypothetical protein
MNPLRFVETFAKTKTPLSQFKEEERVRLVAPLAAPNAVCYSEMLCQVANGADSCETYASMFLWVSTLGHEDDNLRRSSRWCLKTVP